MLNRSGRRWPAPLAALVLLLPVTGYAQGYRNPPAVLSDAAARGAADIRAEFDSTHDAANAAGLLDEFWNRLVFYTVADALPGDDLHAIRGLAAYRYLAEVTRTDKQTGAASGAPGSTTLSEHAGIAELLALAVEHGAVESSTDGTGLTLSTSPYAFVRLLEPDNAANFDRFGLWRRLGASATFNLASSAPVAGTVDFKQLSAWSLRLRILGDRSTRSPAFTRRWIEVVQPKVQARLNALTGAIRATVDGTPALRTAADDANGRLLSTISAYLGSSGNVSATDREAALTAMILSALHESVYDPVAGGTIQLPAPVRQQLDQSVDRLVTAHQDLFQSEEELGGILDDLNHSLLLTAAFTRHTAAADSAYSDLRLMFEDRVAPFDAVVNAFVSIYDPSAIVPGQSRVRDYGASVDLEGKVANPFGRKSAADVVEPVMLSVGYRLSRLEGADQMVHIVQAKASIPISAGVELPISLTWASRTSLIDEDHVRGNFGISLDLDKLYALGRALTGMSR